MTPRSHRVPLLTLALVIAAAAAPAASASATQFPTARQIAQHQGRLGAASRAVNFPTARQIAQHQGTAGAPSTQASVQFPTARQVALHEGKSSGSPLLSTDRVASNSGFSWGDAGIGAGAALVLVTALLYGAFIVNNRRRRGLRRASAA
jgi:curli biogenesis system outer membrane secretion channel CsgG